MLRGVVDNVPTALLVLIGVGLVVGLVALGVWLVRRYIPATREGFDAEVSSQLLGVVATLFGLLLAFVVVLAFQAYSDADDNARQEADALAQIVRDSGAFPAADRTRVQAAVGRYVRTVINEEWELLRDGKFSRKAGEAMEGLYAAMETVRPQTAAGHAFYDDSVRRLNDALAARRNRVSDASGGLSALLVGMLFLGSLLILGYAILVGSKSAAFHLIGAGAIAVVLGFSLVMLVVYDYPYSGGLAIDPGPFREGVLARFFG